MVTASDGRPSAVTNRPFTAPRIAPIRTHSGMIVSSGTPLFHMTPMAELVNPTMLATDRSISPVAMIRVIGRASNKIGARSSTRKPALRDVPKCSTVAAAITMTASVARMIATSQVANRWSRNRPAPRPVRVSADMGILLPQRRFDPQADEAVQGDGAEDERSDDRPLPELVDAQHRQGIADDREQHGAERGTHDRSAAAED